jgi:ADP-heptose:LPS heptosyltransferase
MFQSLEGAVRSAFLRSLNRISPLEGPAPLPDWSARPYRVLFLRDDRVGDMIASLEVMRAIAESSPTISLDVLASRHNESLARGYPWISELLVNQHASILGAAPLRRQIAGRRYDVVIDGRVFVGSVNVQRTLMLRSSRARWRVGLAGRKHGEVYNVPVQVPDLPHWIDYLVALASPFGIAPDSRDWRPRVRVEPTARADAEDRWGPPRRGEARVLVNISAGHRNRRWPDDRWLALLQRLRKRLPQASIALLAMLPDRASAERLAAPVRASALTLSLEDSIATVATADLVITPDTAISHIASAFERPTLTLLRKGFERLVPYRTPGRNVFADDARTLESLPAARAVDALDDLLSNVRVGAA